MIGEMFKLENGLEVRVRGSVGIVIGTRLYAIKKFGATASLGDEWRLELLASEFWRTFPRQGVEEVPVYEWQLGAPFECDDEGEIVGDWPEIGVLVLPYSDAFLMPNGELPEDRQHLHRLSLGAVAIHKFRLEGVGDGG